VTIDLNKIKVVMCPSNLDYIKTLKNLLNKKGVDVFLFRYISPISILKLLILRMYSYKILHIHFLYIFPSILIMKIFVKFCRLINYKIVWTVHNVLPHHHTKKDIIKTKWFYENIDYHFVHYETNLKRLQNLGITIENTSLINHPIYNIYLNEIDSKTARNKLGIPFDKRVLLSFGQIFRGRILWISSWKKC